MKRALLLLSLMVFSPLASADAKTNTGILTVTAIKGNWASDGSQYIYKYTFKAATDADFGGALPCKPAWKSFSPDANINRLLDIAYQRRLQFKAGIDSYSNCQISTVELQQGQPQ
ncbi:hypothetical protein BOSP111201_01885 [Bordetella sputigena]|uniref:hypothetical protein n=1 Tax=Bordetella sputigena TaxID=1416810 RepID=UPI0039EECA5C